MNLSQYYKPGKQMIIELDDEVEYIVDEQAVAAIEREDAFVVLTRIIDHKLVPVELARIEASLHNRGVVDYLD